MKNLLRSSVVLFIVLAPLSVSAQNRWFQTGTASYQRVDWDTVAVVIFYNNPSTTGARLYTFTNGKIVEWGAIPQGTTSATKLFHLITGDKARWIKVQPLVNGAYLQPNQAAGYVDLRRVISSTKITPIDFGQEVYSLGMADPTARMVILDPAEKARFDMIISDSLNP